MNAADVKLKLTADTSDALADVDKFGARLRALKNDANAGYFNTLSAQKKGAIALSGVNAALDVAQAIAPLVGGNENLVKSLRSVEQSTKQYMTALAPLAPPFGAVIGAGIGLVTGAIKELAGASEESANRINAALQSLRDSSADAAIKDRRAETPEDKAKLQHEARERMADYRVKLERGATISDNEVLDAARWDSKLARKMLKRSRELNGGQISDKLRPLENLYNSDEAYIRRMAGYEDGYTPNLSRKQVKAWANLYAQLQQDKEALGPEIVGTISAPKGRAFDKSLDRLYEEMMAPKGAKTTGLSEKLAPGRTAHERGAQADSWSAQGIGYTGNPMQTTETLLREIGARLAEVRDIARRTARTPLPAVAI